jgi:hypothetical protein
MFQTLWLLSIRTIHGLAEASEEETANQSPCDGMREARSFLLERLIVQFAAFDDLDLDLVCLFSC